MSENSSFSLKKHNESEFKKVEAVKTLAHLIKKYAGELIKENNNNKSSC
ncbi:MULTISPECIES: hypothetical protein [Bacillaceae]|nr:MULTISPECIES: hypothetical protein [Bacillaceae]MEC2074004.1 hypothetical protein [Alkalihalophilus marmarensis]TWG74408.1 hypothetical protein L604_000700001030 [Bacillus subtilis J27]